MSILVHDSNKAACRAAAAALQQGCRAALVRPAGTVMCEQDEIWQESRYFSEAKMGELYDEGGTRGVDGTVGWARLEAEARKTIESGLEHADRIEAA